MTEGAAGRISPETVMRMATDYLSRHAASSLRLRQVLDRRLRRRLARAGEGAEAADLAAVIDPVVDKLQRAGLVDDAAFARGRAASLAAKGRPAWRIRAELAQRHGIDAAAGGLAEALDSLDPEVQAMRWARRRRLGPFRLRDRAARRERDIASLARAGFGVEVARAVVDAAPPEPGGHDAD